MATVKFLKGTLQAYNALATKDPDTYYYTTDTNNKVRLFLGSTKLANFEDIEALDTNDIVTASLNSSTNEITLANSIKQTDGLVSKTGTDITLAAVAKTGNAEDVSYDNTTSELPGSITNVQDAIEAVVSGLGTAAAADVATSAITEESTDTGLVSAAQVASFVTSEIAGLEGAMHFRGVITRQQGETDAQAIARVITDPSSGDAVVMSDNAKEYLYDGTNWREVGDEGLYVTKSTTIADIDLQDNISKAELLTALNVDDGAQVNTIEKVKVNGTQLSIDSSDKSVNILIEEGSTNGTLSVNNASVAVHGLGSAAYTDSTAYDSAGSAASAQAAAQSYADSAVETALTWGTIGS